MLDTSIVENIHTYRFHEFAKSKGVKGLRIGMKRIEMLEFLVSKGFSVEEVLMYAKAPITEKPNYDVKHTLEPDVTYVQQTPVVTKVAIYTEGRIAVHGVGIFEKGYHIIDKSVEPQMLRSKRVRTVSPTELAAYYGEG